MFVNFFKHLHVVNSHRWLVFKFCCRAGIPLRGLLHDLSKYSPTEFLEGVRFFSGKYSPITNCKKELGYSEAWLHHFGRNKHHYEYWYDETAPVSTPVIPYKYTVEMICDTLAAGKTYQKEKWTKDYQLSYYMNKRGKIRINPKIDAILMEVYTKVSQEDIGAVLSSKVLKEIYIRHVGKII